MAGKFSHILKSNSVLPPSQLSYKIDLGTLDALLTLSHHLQVALERSMEGTLVQLNFSVAFDRVSHCGMLYKLRSIGIREQFLSIVLEFLVTESSACIWMVVSASVNVISVVPQGSVLGPLLFTLYTPELFHIFVNHILGYTVCTTIYAVIPRPLSRPQVMKSLNQDLQ